MRKTPITLLLPLLLPLLPLGGACDGGDDQADAADGADGTDGADGADGTDGADGSDGSDGSDGTDGTDGTDGGPPHPLAHTYTGTVGADILDAGSGTYLDSCGGEATLVIEVSGQASLSFTCSSATFTVNAEGAGALISEVRAEGDLSAPAIGGTGIWAATFTSGAGPSDATLLGDLSGSAMGFAYTARVTGSFRP